MKTPDLTAKVCTGCFIEKPITEFYNLNRRNHCGKQSRCKFCQKYDDKLNYLKHYTPERRRRYLLKEKYNMTIEDYENLSFQQENVCAICGNKETNYTSNPQVTHLAVDHDHLSGRIRGLLCAQCNQAIGKFRHDINLLQKAIDYLKGYKCEE